MTPKPSGFRTLGVKHPKDLLTRVKKATKLNLAILSINPIFSSFDVKTQCLMRQEVQLLNEKKKKKLNSFLSYLFIFIIPMLFIQ